MREFNLSPASPKKLASLGALTNAQILPLEKEGWLSELEAFVFKETGGSERILPPKQQKWLEYYWPMKT